MRTSPFKYSYLEREMACKMQRRIALRRKLQILRALAKSKAEKKSSIVADTFLYIHKLRLQVEAIKKECQHLIDHIQEVKVENLGVGYLRVRVRCSKSEEVMASILETFEELNVNVLQASFNCRHVFQMEAIVEASHVEPPILNQAILNVVHKCARA